MTATIRTDVYFKTASATHYLEYSFQVFILMKNANVCNLFHCVNKKIRLHEAVHFWWQENEGSAELRIPAVDMEKGKLESAAERLISAAQNAVPATQPNGDGKKCIS